LFEAYLISDLPLFSDNLALFVPEIIRRTPELMWYEHGCLIDIHTAHVAYC